MQRRKSPPSAFASELEAVVAMRKLLATEGVAADLRRSAGLTRADVARAVGCTAAAVAHWEAGARRPRGEHARRYALVLKSLSTEAER